MEIIDKNVVQPLVRTIFISKIPQELRNEDLRAILQACGPLENFGRGDEGTNCFDLCYATYTTVKAIYCAYRILNKRPLLVGKMSLGALDIDITMEDAHVTEDKRVPPNEKHKSENRIKEILHGLKEKISTRHIDQMSNRLRQQNTENDCKFLDCGNEMVPNNMTRENRENKTKKRVNEIKILEATIIKKEAYKEKYKISKHEISNKDAPPAIIDLTEIDHKNKSKNPWSDDGSRLRDCKRRFKEFEDFQEFKEFKKWCSRKHNSSSKSKWRSQDCGQHRKYNRDYDCKVLYETDTIVLD